MSKVAIITDTHYGARKGSKLFHDYFEKFYNDIFFPAIDEHGIDTVIHMGDAFDSRKGIDFKALDWAKRVVFEPLKQRGITMHLMVGNHDASTMSSKSRELEVPHRASHTAIFNKAESIFRIFIVNPGNKQDTQSTNFNFLGFGVCDYIIILL